MTTPPRHRVMPTWSVNPTCSVPALWGCEGLWSDTLQLHMAMITPPPLLALAPSSLRSPFFFFRSRSTPATPRFLSKALPQLAQHPAATPRQFRTRPRSPRTQRMETFLLPPRATATCGSGLLTHENLSTRWLWARVR